MRNIKCGYLLFCLLILTGCSKPAAIQGTVKDFFSIPMVGVQVTIENSAFAAVTDTKGRYQIEYVPGTVTVVFSKKGYSSDRMELNLATKDKYPAQDIVLVNLPDSPGVYLYEKDKCTPLASNKIGIAGTFMESISGISHLSKTFTTDTKPTFLIYGNGYPAGSLAING